MTDAAFTHCRASDGTRLAVRSFPAEGTGPVVLLLHGIASHMGWYSGMASELQSRGISMYLFDRRGVARSEGTRAHARTWTVLVDDVTCMARDIAQRHPSQPLHGMGISLGGAIVTATAIRHPELFRSLALISPALASTVRMPLWRRVTTLGRAFITPTRLQNLPFGVAQLTGNLKWREVLERDPRRTRQVSARFMLEFLRLQRFIRRNLARVNGPVLAFFGAMDEIIDNERSIALLNGMHGAMVHIEVFETVTHLLSASIPRRQLAERLAIWFKGDVGSETERFSLLRTVLSHPATDNDEPPVLDDGD